MNIELLERIKAKILEEPENFQMETWHCGTAHCIGGWAQILSGQATTCYTAFDAIRALGISSTGIVSQADRLFIQNHWPEQFRKPCIVAGQTGQTSGGEDRPLHRNRRERMTTPLAESPLSKPRWPGGPPICKRANLPMFTGQAEAKAFMQRDCPRVSIDLIVPCDACGGFHVHGHGPNPSGDSSGTGRGSK